MTRTRDQEIEDHVDRFHALGHELKRLKVEREDLRFRLIQYASDAGLNRLVGRRARVQIKAYHAAKLPENKSPARERLEALVRDAGRWEEVSHLSAARLRAALDRDRFTAVQRQAIEAELPEGQAYRLSTRPLKPKP